MQVAFLAMAVAGFVGCGAAHTIEHDPAAVAAVRDLFHLADEDAASAYLDRAIAATRAGGPTVDRAAIVWSARVQRIAASIDSRLTATPETEVKVRAFVVSATCDAFRQAQTQPLSADDVGAIVSRDRLLVELPPIVGEAQMLSDIANEISTSLTEDDLAGSFPGLAQIFICVKLGS
jgi:hypothetical protein